MDLLIVDNGTQHLDELRVALRHDPDVIARDQLRPSHANGYDAIVLTGGGGLLKKHEPVKEFVLRCDAPLLGICWGFHLLASAYGNRTKKMTKKRSAALNVEIERPDPLFEEVERMRVMEAHQWVVPAVKPPLEVLARSSDGIEAVKHPDRTTYGLQSHPELGAAGPAGQRILDNFLAISAKLAS